MKKFSDFNILPMMNNTLVGLKIKMSGVLNRNIIVHDYKIVDSKHHQGEKCLYLQINLDGSMRVIFTGSAFLIDTVSKIPKDGFPFTTKIVEINQMFQFS